MPYQLCVLGCGTMGIAVLSGVLDNLASPRANPNLNGDSGPSTPMGSIILDPNSNPESLPDRFIATVNRAETVKKLRRTFNDLGPLGSTVQVRQATENVKSVAESDVILLCCKPQLAAHVLLQPGMTEALEGKLLISILAGTTISMMREWVPESCTVVRSMPNTPAKIREGMTVISSLDPALPKTPVNRDILTALFTPLGRCRFMEEKHFDAVTAVAGSGPAFACVVLEAMADGGVMMGLPRAEALELAAQTMQGAARMVLQTGVHPAALKDSVTTPGGCTIAGLLHLEDGRLRGCLARCIQATTEHAAGLGKVGKKPVASRAARPAPKPYRLPRAVDIRMREEKSWVKALWDTRDEWADEEAPDEERFVRTVEQFNSHRPPSLHTDPSAVSTVLRAWRKELTTKGGYLPLFHREGLKAEKAFLCLAVSENLGRHAELFADAAALTDGRGRFSPTEDAETSLHSPSSELTGLHTMYLLRSMGIVYADFQLNDLSNLLHLDPNMHVQFDNNMLVIIPEQAFVGFVWQYVLQLQEEPFVYTSFCAALQQSGPSDFGKIGYELVILCGESFKVARVDRSSACLYLSGGDGAFHHQTTNSPLGPLHSSRVTASPNELLNPLLLLVNAAQKVLLDSRIRDNLPSAFADRLLLCCSIYLVLIGNLHHDGELLNLVLTTAAAEKEWVEE
ncbi:hypothetical protein JCM10207_002726 [Rhodosporidiobolus poonsookiae]